MRERGCVALPVMQPLMEASCLSCLRPLFVEASVLVFALITKTIKAE